MKIAQKVRMYPPKMITMSPKIIISPVSYLMLIFAFFSPIVASRCFELLEKRPHKNVTFFLWMATLRSVVLVSETAPLPSQIVLPSALNVGSFWGQE